MATPLQEDIAINIKALIAKITGHQEGSDTFNSLEKCALTTLKKSDSMYFLTKKDVKGAISSMADKFVFHGFPKHADHLKKCLARYVDENLSESDLGPRLNVVKFLLCMSRSPTTRFWEAPEQFEFVYAREAEAEETDWGAYLNEGIERWSPAADGSFASTESEGETDADATPLLQQSQRRVLITDAPQAERYELEACRERLLDAIQAPGGVSARPPSDWFDANVGILWEQHLERQVAGLIRLDPVLVVTEYKALREIVWQMWGPHNSTVFRLVEGRLRPRSHVTISSVCSITFEQFMEEFIEYIDLLHGFTLFYDEIMKDEDAPQTYKSYGEGVRKITEPVFAQLMEIENEIREQETTFTLLKLAGKLETIVRPVRILKTIHEEAIQDYKSKSRLECAVRLLVNLRNGLQFSLNKLEQDIRLSLYLESLYYYFNLINAWLMRNDLTDYSKEFVIENKNRRETKHADNDQMNFFLGEIEEACRNDGMIKIITTQILQIGRNLHLLRLLGRYKGVIPESPETIYREFIRRILEEMAGFYNAEVPVKRSDEGAVEKVPTYFDLNQMGDWTNYVDMSDGFLVKAFEGFYEKRAKPVRDFTLYEKICKITTSLYPIQDFPERVLSSILKERFTVSGLMVKNLFIEKYSLDKQFEFLSHIFLFHEDLIFPFYRRLFEQMNTENSNWGIDFWLTSHLQDILMDLYPNFYENCIVDVQDVWKSCRDSLEACSLLCLRYEIKWPLNIIITKEHIAKYEQVFQFILKIKWALYTINHLSFADLEVEKHYGEPSKRTKRLKYLRFVLINVLNSVQHYLFGFIFKKYKIQFELDFEKANDLKSLKGAHEDFIDSLFGAIMEIRDTSRGFSTLLKCVKMLKVMWKGREATLEHLDDCHEKYKISYKVINSIVNPVYIRFDN